MWILIYKDDVKESFQSLSFHPDQYVRLNIAKVPDIRMKKISSRAKFVFFFSSFFACSTGFLAIGLTSFLMIFVIYGK